MRSASSRLSLVALVALVAIVSLGCGEGAPARPDVEAHGGDGTSQGAPGGAPRLRRLSTREYVATVRDLLGEVVDPSRFFEDSLPTGYANGDATLTVQPDQALVYQALAAELADRAVTVHLDRLIGTCDPAREASRCRGAFFGGFVTRALRRPPRDAERARLDALFDAGNAEGGFLRGLSVVVETILEWPSFLYREELGDDRSLPAGTPRTLTSYELATELSYFLTGRAPDDALLAAAREARLDTPADLRREAERLLGTPAAGDMLRAFAHAWLGTDHVDGLVKDRAVFPRFDPTLAASMRQDLDAAYDVAQGGSLADLFSTRTGSVDAELAALYDVAPPSGGARRVVDLGPERQGVLTRAGYLAVHASVDSSNPVARGVFLRAALVCAPLPPPPAGAAAQTDFGHDPHTTTRQKYAEHATNPTCQSCHRAIDGVGFGFESYDGLGAFRTTENGEPVDASGEIVGITPEGPFTGVPELEARLLAGPDLPRCFVRQVFRSAMGRGEGPSDAATLGALEARFDVHTRVRDLLLDVVVSRAFTERTVEEP